MAASNLLFIALSLGMSGIAVAADSEQPRAGAQICSERQTGDPELYLVGSERTAKAIFIAVESDYFPHADRKNFPEVRVRNGGAYWSVWRTRLRTRQHAHHGKIIVNTAGHQLSMDIDKCSAEVSNVLFTR